VKQQHRVSGSPKITIVIPTFNAMALLPECIASIVEVAGELLGAGVFVRVQDGMSQDEVANYVHDLPHAGISISQESDSGIYDAMNKAVAGIETPWVYFLGADDRLMPGFTEMVAQLSGEDAIYYGDVLYASDLQKYDGNFSPLKLVYRNICHQAIFYPTRILSKNPFQTKYPIKADWAANICLMSKYKYHYLNCDVAVFNNGGGTSGNDDDIVFDADKNRLFRTNFGGVYYLLSLTAPLFTVLYQLFRRPRR
jgi:glycosyltransferase involved in cell wall biosynthesis